MEGCDGELDGRPGELTFRRYVRFGAGGAKIDLGRGLRRGRRGPRQPAADHRSTNRRSADFARMVAECRQAHRDANGDDSDLLFGLQLTHSGRYSHRRPIIATHDPLLVGRYKADRRYAARYRRRTEAAGRSLCRGGEARG